MGSINSTTTGEKTKGYQGTRGFQRADKPAKKTFYRGQTRGDIRRQRESRIEHQFINVCRDMLPERMFNDAMKMAKNRVKEAELQRKISDQRVREAETNRAAREARISNGR